MGGGTRVSDFLLQRIQILKKIFFWVGREGPRVSDFFYYEFKSKIFFFFFLWGGVRFGGGGAGVN